MARTLEQAIAQISQLPDAVANPSHALIAHRTIVLILAHTSEAVGRTYSAWRLCSPWVMAC